MAELEPADVEQYTQGRLAEDDPETERLLAAALAAARRYCGWPVTPVIEDDEITLDGPCSSLLVLPTLRLIELTEVVEDGTTLDVSTLDWSPRGLVRKQPSLCRPSWTGKLGGLVVTMTHGFADAPDWQAAVLSMIDRVSLLGAGGREVVGPFQFSAEASVAGAAFSAMEKAILDLYRLERAP